MILTSSTARTEVDATVRGSAMVRGTGVMLTPSTARTEVHATMSEVANSAWRVEVGG